MELKTKDLRIGNYATTTGIPEKVRGIVDNLVYFSDDTSCGIGYVFPIELSSDILIKAGFTERYGNYEHFLFNIFILNGGTVYLGDQQMVDSNFKIENEIKYVHQLQNLIYLLFGTELNITL